MVWGSQDLTRSVKGLERWRQERAAAMENSQVVAPVCPARLRPLTPGTLPPPPSRLLSAVWLATPPTAPAPPKVLWRLSQAGPQRCPLESPPCGELSGPQPLWESSVPRGSVAPPSAEVSSRLEDCLLWGHIHGCLSDRGKSGKELSPFCSLS